MRDTKLLLGYSTAVTRQIPDPNARGVYSFDWEFWYPSWEPNGISGRDGLGRVIRTQLTVFCTQNH